MGRYFGTDGIRGKANEVLTAERAFQVGRYLGYYFSKEGKNKIVIGKDTRLSSDMFENALAAGITSEGCDAYLAGYCPTPMICLLTKENGFACGAMISASHNPFYDMVLKYSRMMVSSYLVILKTSLKTILMVKLQFHIVQIVKLVR